jgi:ribosomal protein L7/L12
MMIGEAIHKAWRWLNTRECVRAGHKWYPENGSLPKDCPECVAELVGRNKEMTKDEVVAYLNGLSVADFIACMSEVKLKEQPTSEEDDKFLPVIQQWGLSFVRVFAGPAYGGPPGDSPGWNDHLEPIIYDIILESVEQKNRLKAMAVIRDQLGVELKTAKSLLDQMPCVLAQKEDYLAQDIARNLREVGCVIELKPR